MCVQKPVLIHVKMVVMVAAQVNVVILVNQIVDLLAQLIAIPDVNHLAAHHVPVDVQRNVQDVQVVVDLTVVVVVKVIVKIHVQHLA